VKKKKYHKIKEEAAVRYLVEDLRNELQRAEFFVKAYVFDADNKRQPRRDSFFSLQKNIADFMQESKSPRWFMLSGLRGTGKTTLLAQLYDDCKKYDAYSLFLSMDTRYYLGQESHLNKVITAYEDLIGRFVENLDKPLFIFIDEVQSEPNWGLILKNLYDRASQVFIVATGSQALYLNSNTDIARRAFFENILPLTFKEYLKIKNILPEQELEKLNKPIADLILNSPNAKFLYEKLCDLNKEVAHTLLPLSRFEIKKYLQYGSLPYLLNIANEALIYEQIRANLEKIIDDVTRLGKFSVETSNKIDALLYLLADSDTKSLEDLSRETGISKPTLITILEILEKTEVLARIWPYASHTNQISKSSKYLFVSPAFRAMYFNFMGSTRTAEDAIGKLLEDIVGMYLNMRKEYNNRITSLNYDANKGGADFVISLGKERIIVEVSSGHKGYEQIVNTQKKIKTKSKYNLVICNDTLHYSEEYNAVRIPWELFLLL
jgi:predicted AAA+ superfamily ATPase